MDAPAIRARGLGKRYPVFDNPRQRLLHALGVGSRGAAREVWALRDIDFEVRRGESLGVIGRNGGGKSTLLQILTGTLAQTTGRVEVAGRVSALLELGSGFNPEYTGRDNVMLSGLVMGFSRREILRRFEAIAAFAEIGDAMERPIKTYSSGMLMRLAFSVQALADPEILIVDEALSVGDFFFQQKCLEHIRRLREQGVTLLFVSHDMATVRDLCGRAIYLREGRAAFIGETRDAIRHYLSETGETSPPDANAGQAASMAAEGELQTVLADAAWRPSKVVAADTGGILAVALYDSEGSVSTSFMLGTSLRIKIAYRPSPSGPTHVQCAIRNKFGQVVTSLGSSRLGLRPPEAKAGTVIFEMTVVLSLEAGGYSLTASLSRLDAPNRGQNVDTSDPIGPLTIHWDYENAVAPFLGMVGLPASAVFRVATGTPASDGRENARIAE